MLETLAESTFTLEPAVQMLLLLVVTTTRRTLLILGEALFTLHKAETLRKVLLKLITVLTTPTRGVTCLSCTGTTEVDELVDKFVTTTSPQRKNNLMFLCLERTPTQLVILELTLVTLEVDPPVRLMSPYVKIVQICLGTSAEWKLSALLQEVETRVEFTFTAVSLVMMLHSLVDTFTELRLIHGALVKLRLMQMETQ